MLIFSRLAGHTIASSVYEASIQNPTKDFWKNPRWQLLRTILQVQNLISIIITFYSLVFGKGCSFQKYVPSNVCPKPALNGLGTPGVQFLNFYCYPGLNRPLSPFFHPLKLLGYLLSCCLLNLGKWTTFTVS